MTVAELIEVLQGYRGDLPVATQGCDGTVERVDVEPNSMTIRLCSCVSGPLVIGLPGHTDEHHLRRQERESIDRAVRRFSGGGGGLL